MAVIRLEKPPADLVAARLGDSDALDVGEWVLAVGSPLGLDQTVTAGHRQRQGAGGAPRSDVGRAGAQYIQTDAKINPGNSGGPLVNLSSEVVGINTLINTGPGGAYGFAIPVNQVKLVAASLMKEGRVRYPYLGVMVGDVGEMDADRGRRRRALTAGGVRQPGDARRAGREGGPARRRRHQRHRRSQDRRRGRRDRLRRDAGRSAAASTSTFVRDGKKQTVPVALGELPSPDQARGGAGGAAGDGVADADPRSGAVDGARARAARRGRRRGGGGSAGGGGRRPRGGCHPRDRLPAGDDGGRRRWRRCHATQGGAPRCGCAARPAPASSPSAAIDRRSGWRSRCCSGAPAPPPRGRRSRAAERRAPAAAVAALLDSGASRGRRGGVRRAAPDARRPRTSGRRWPGSPTRSSRWWRRTRRT